MMNRDRNGDAGREPPLPKPYAFVPLPEQPARRSAPAGHHRYSADRWSGTLRVQLVARSPIHVASGLLEPKQDRAYPLVKGHVRTGGQLMIPGTSLKGCVRSIVEAISGSAVQITRERDLPGAYQPSRSQDQLDTTQRIFGMLGYQGMIQFADAILVSGGPTIVPSVQLFRPRPESVDTYFEGRQPRGRKFYMHGALATGNLPLEACAEGSQFALEMTFEHLSAGELGVVLIALGLGTPQLWPKLGGGKPACLGTVEVVAPQIEAFRGATAYTDFDAAPESLDLQGVVASARQERLVSDEHLRQVAEVLRWPRPDRQCPDRSY